MRALLDTHAFLWWLSDDPPLSRHARLTIGRASNELLVSAASACEIATKVRLGKLGDPSGLADRIGAQIAEEGFAELSITVEHGRRAGALPAHHKDPWDRMLVAQAQAEGIPILSNATIFDSYGARLVTGPLTPTLSPEGRGRRAGERAGTGTLYKGMVLTRYA